MRVLATAALLLAGVVPRAGAQPAAAVATGSAAASAAASAASAASAAQPAAAAASAPGQTVEVTATRSSDTEARRQSTAAKIVVGREEIERFGDATVGEVLRRLPGVTTPGAPGRGGPPRMRGLGSGYTQLLIDGQRLPPGFSLESLTPEQIERIEILRAPTAETGARAIAGTINIITREGFRKRLNDWRLGVGLEDGKPSLGSFWSHNNSDGDLTYTLSAGLFVNQRRSEARTDTVVTDVADIGTLLEDRSTFSHGASRNIGLNVNARLQWRLGDGGDALILMPGFNASRNRGESQYRTVQRLQQAGLPELADQGSNSSRNRFFGPRLMWQYRQRVGDWRLEGGGNLGASQARSEALRDERRADDSPLRWQQDRSQSRERRLELNLKGRRLLGPEGAEHSLVLGAEAEGARRDDTRATLEDGLPTLTDYGDNFQASTLRVAAFAQDEWNLNPQWALHAGLRWEAISTRGDDGLGQRPENRASVATPLLHLLWKPDPKRRDQVRLSLTRSWRTPPTNTLIGRPSVTRLYDPAVSGNVETSPDSAGNPSLKPELASGVDLAFERYLDGGGLLSANLFARRIRDLMRSQVELETVPWSAFQRWVRRTRNIGNADVRGLELEAKFRLDQLLADSLPIELRANLAFYQSRVDTVPGPDNRLDQQARATGNLGGDYRLRGLPLTVGANLNWVPGTRVRLAADQFSDSGSKRQWDLFALWTFNPGMGLRLMANNAVPLDYATATVNDSFNPVRGGTDQSTVTSLSPSYINWQLRLELKL